MCPFLSLQNVIHHEASLLFIFLHHTRILDTHAYTLASVPFPKPPFIHPPPSSHKPTSPPPHSFITPPPTLIPSANPKTQPPPSSTAHPHPASDTHKYPHSQEYSIPPYLVGLIHPMDCFLSGFMLAFKAKYLGSGGRGRGFGLLGVRGYPGYGWGRALAGCL